MRIVDPFEEMDRVMASMGGRWRGGMMPMDAYEKDGVYTLRFDLPGVDPDHVDVTVENQVMRVTAERKFEETEGANWVLRERPTGTHSRDVHLGDRLDAERISAGYDNGVLTITIPIKEQARPHKVAVATGSQEKITAGASS